MSEKTLQTINEVIEALGGSKSVREITGRKAVSVVPSWRYRKQFPPQTYTLMKAALEERGYSAPNKLWGMP